MTPENIDSTEGSGCSTPPCSAFYVHRRDAGHWDISIPQGKGRVFAIRGASGAFSVTDYRNSPATESIGFRTLDVVMAYCMAELMYEPNVSDEPRPESSAQSTTPNTHE